jgi:hypothetical protein
VQIQHVLIVLTKRHKVIGCIDKLESVINFYIVYYEIRDLHAFTKKIIFNVSLTYLFL